LTRPVIRPAESKTKLVRIELVVSGAWNTGFQSRHRLVSLLRLVVASRMLSTP
jgi:hypothetical protein